MSKKIDRAVHGPGWGEVILGAVLSLVLGAVLGAALLIARPVATVRELPKEEDRTRGTVYYVEGSRETAKARQATAKQKALLAGQSVNVTEDEINAIVAAATTPPPAPAAKAGEKKEEPAETGMLSPGTPNFRIRDGVVQIGVPVTINALGLGEKVIVQARGGFVKRDDMFVFEPQELYVGSCPVQRVPLLSGFVRNQVLANQKIPDEMIEAWKKLSDVSVEGNTLKLTM